MKEKRKEERKKDPLLDVKSREEKLACIRVRG